LISVSETAAVAFLSELDLICHQAAVGISAAGCLKDEFERIVASGD
jgi:hypothetical protein